MQIEKQKFANTPHQNENFFLIKWESSITKKKKKDKGESPKVQLPIIMSIKFFK
jgi:hypothetical protein